MHKRLWTIILAISLVAATTGCGPTSRRPLSTPQPTVTSVVLDGTEQPTKARLTSTALATRTASTGATPTPEDPSLAVIRAAAHPLTGAAGDYDALVDLIGDARFVLLGEATHGTHEFYVERVRITRRLIEEEGFAAVAIEGEWPEAYEVNRYVRGVRDDPGPEVSLSGFAGFPEWMWNNAEVRDFVAWLEQYNRALPGGAPQAGFYGLDLYSLEASSEAVVEYLRVRDPVAAETASGRYACLSRTGYDPADYDSPSESPASSCDALVQEQLEELQVLQQAQPPRSNSDASMEKDELFSAVQNALIVKNKRVYDKAPSTGPDSSWNVRDQHMADTLERLSEHLAVDGRPGRVVVWAHNTHVGDARATEMAEREELNIGQLMRERQPDDTVLVGFTLYEGKVLAARSWDEPGQQFDVAPAIPESYDGLFHDAGIGNALLILRDAEQLAEAMDEPRLQRGIGVAYTPSMERAFNYYTARLSKTFDAVIHIERTTAIKPLQP